VPEVARLGYGFRRSLASIGFPGVGKKLSFFGFDSENIYARVPLTPPKKEAGRLVHQHKADPEPSTFSRKDEDYDYS